MKSRFIVDTDPGIDDIFALKANINIAAFTTVFGNTSVTNATSNAYLAQGFSTGQGIEVYPGASTSLLGRTITAESSGLYGNNGLAAPSATFKGAAGAIEYLSETLRKNDGQIELICIGPLTNVAILYSLYPELLTNISRVLIMGGVFDEPGNITPFAEFNAYADPEAFVQVLYALETRGIETVLFPANLCRKLIFNRDELQLVSNPRQDSQLQKLVRPYIDYYLKNETYGGFAGAVLYDVLPMLYVCEPGLFSTERGRISVELAQTEQLGRTSFRKNSSSCIKRAVDIDVQKAKALFMSVMNDSALMYNGV